MIRLAACRARGCSAHLTFFNTEQNNTRLRAYTIWLREAARFRDGPEQAPRAQGRVHRVSLGAALGQQPRDRQLVAGLPRHLAGSQLAAMTGLCE